MACEKMATESIFLEKTINMVPFLLPGRAVAEGPETTLHVNEIRNSTPKLCGSDHDGRSAAALSESHQPARPPHLPPHWQLPIPGPRPKAARPQDNRTEIKWQKSWIVMGKKKLISI